ncbi:MAG: ABC transporter permease [Betaproteobacteria bacterium AqS2]|uniref:ABC transporter permease n=1 Tax=Candidatus Amphirhobacter heronislandensis TaxID=1732024 RepID=A0A930Y3C7_9GAMM|nr:ABC transporter permease [Betaproteobacteria bacterium AqS2]
MIAARVPGCLKRPRLVWVQVYHLGTLSLPIIIVAGLFIGLVIGLQFHTILDRYGQTQVVGAAVAIALFRELGPVFAGLLFIGCSCTAVTASIGLKRSSEQFAAMEVMAVDPLEREIAPRFVAGALCLPLLTVILLAVAITGTYAIVVLQIGMDEGFFWGNMQRFTKFFGDFTEGLLKSVVFGVMSSAIALYHGYSARPTAEGVARATTNTVVYASLTLLGLDFVITSLLAS